jgi:hypothetical protein
MVSRVHRELGGCGAARHLYNPGAAFGLRSGFVALDATSHSFNGASSTIG